MTDVGDGQIDFQPFFTEVPRKGSHHYIVERDTAPQNPLGSFSTAERSFAYLDALQR
jgi:hypothetical protein